MKYDCLVFIGRFQPFHNGHKHIVEEGLKISRKIIIFCGSTNQERSVKNPWSYTERKICISRSFNKTVFKRLYTLPLTDHPNDMIWVKRIEKKVKKVMAKDGVINIAVIGYQKNESSYYLKLFPKWHEVKVGNFKNIDATYIRKAIFTGKSKQEVIDKIQNLVPEGVLLFLLDFLETNIYLKLKDL